MEEKVEIKICKLLGGEILDGEICKIPRKFYKTNKNCLGMSGSVKDDGSCEIPFKFLKRLLRDNKYS